MARDNRSAGRPQDTLQLLPRHLDGPRGQQLVRDDEIGEVGGQDRDIPGLNDHARAQQARRSQPVPGDLELLGVFLESDDLEVGDLGQLIGELAQIAVENEAIPFRDLAFVHDPACRIAVQLSLGMALKDLGIADDPCFFRRRALLASAKQQILPSSVLTIRRPPPAARPRAFPAMPACHTLPAGLGFDAEDLFRAAHEKGVARQDQGTALWQRADAT